MSTNLKIYLQYFLKKKKKKLDTAFVSQKKKKKKKNLKMQKLHGVCEFENAHEYGILNKNL